VTRDQTEQREHEEERRTFLEQRIHLLAVTAHELRNPTAVIDGSAATLRSEWDELPPAERDELLDGIRSSADRLRRLAADLGTASRVYGESLQLRFDDISLTGLVNGARRRGAAAGFDEQIIVDVRHESRVHGDSVRLAQALDNLVDNAVRHGEPPIHITAVVEAGQVRILVSDAGSGVPAELVPHLFERFAIAGPSGATGLGLYLVREIARAHGGEAEYHPARGETPHEFELRLPRSGA
jgi:signal transduction histidine kinase